jgi:hypothetical protein
VLTILTVAITVNCYHIYDLHLSYLTVPANIPSIDSTQNNMSHDEHKLLSAEEGRCKVRDLRKKLREYGKPHERLWKMVAGQPSPIGAVKTGLDMELLKLWAQVCGGTLAGD